MRAHAPPQPPSRQPLLVPPSPPTLSCTSADDGSVESAEGWTLVQSTSAPVRFGFVPSDYLQPVAAPPAAAAAAAAPSPAAATSASPAAAPTSFLQRLGAGASPAAAPSAGGIAAASTASAPTVASASAASASAFGGLYSGGYVSSSASSASGASALALGPNVPSAAEEFGQLFASHEEWFRAATAKRHEVYRQLVGEAGDIARALQESEARSAAVVGRLGELDQLLADEKARWAAKNAAAQQEA